MLSGAQALLCGRNFCWGNGAAGCFDVGDERTRYSRASLAVQVLPVFIAKNQLNTYATELCREAEISGRVGSETSRRAAVLTEQTGLSPRISWSKTGNIQLNEDITVTLTLEKNIGLFGGFGSFPITLRSEASGKSEVYHK